MAYPVMADVNASFIRLMRTLVRDGTYPAFATHDPPMVDACRAYADDRGLTAEAFEFQMLYGVRRDLQAALRDQGYRVRIYLPFGRSWFPYLMRRLGERPANVLFIVRSLGHEHSDRFRRLAGR